VPAAEPAWCLYPAVALLSALIRTLAAPECTARLPSRSRDKLAQPAQPALSILAAADLRGLLNSKLA